MKGGAAAEAGVPALGTLTPLAHPGSSIVASGETRRLSLFRLRGQRRSVSGARR